MQNTDLILKDLGHERDALLARVPQVLADDPRVAAWWTSI
jgi:hypothetical protein